MVPFPDVSPPNSVGHTYQTIHTRGTNKNTETYEFHIYFLTYPHGSGHSLIAATIQIIFFLFLALRPNAGHGLLILEVST